MSKCPNCNAGLSCSCKIRKASDGKQVCTSCQQAYENSLKLASTIKQPPR